MAHGLEKHLTTSVQALQWLRLFPQHDLGEDAPGLLAFLIVPPHPQPVRKIDKEGVSLSSMGRSGRSESDSRGRFPTADGSAQEAKIRGPGVKGPTIGMIGTQHIHNIPQAQFCEKLYRAKGVMSDDKQLKQLNSVFTVQEKALEAQSLIMD